MSNPAGPVGCSVLVIGVLWFGVVEGRRQAAQDALPAHARAEAYRLCVGREERNVKNALHQYRLLADNRAAALKAYGDAREGSDSQGEGVQRIAQQTLDSLASSVNAAKTKLDGTLDALESCRAYR
jgi:hypothetical protein